MHRLTMTIKELCHCLGIGRTTAYRLISEDEVLAVKIGGRTLVTVESIHDLVARSAYIKLRTDHDENADLEPLPLRIVHSADDAD